MRLSARPAAWVLPGPAPLPPPPPHTPHPHPRRSPKPNHYLDWLLKGQCKFGGICEAGYIHSFCHYVADYSQFAPEWDVAATLRTLCVDGQGLVQARVQWAAMKHLEQTRSS